MSMLVVLLGCFILSSYVAYQVSDLQYTIRVHSCVCGAHWWIRRWGFWRHMDASPLNDKLQDQWTIWMFEFRTVLVLTRAELTAMGYPDGPYREEDGKPLWKPSKWQRSIYSEPYCLRCMLRG